MKDETTKLIMEVDRVVHEPARLAILTVLSVAEEVEFLFLLKVTGLSKGNLSVQAQKLEANGYLKTLKTFRGRMPVTAFQITEDGKAALAKYHDHIRSLLPAES
jgi:DNA-binding transcriptional ArsR family regulator